MPYGSCGLCKHWGKPTETHKVFRSCQVVIHDGNSLTGDEDRYQDTEEKAKFRADHPAVVVDGSGFFAALKSRADFGCILFSLRTSIELTIPASIK